MSIPGSGLLAALRRKAQGTPEAVVPEESKFAARSSAVHALEHAVASGAAAEASRKVPQGCPVETVNGTFVYHLDEPHPRQAQPELTVRFYFNTKKKTRCHFLISSTQLNFFTFLFCSLLQ